MRAVPPRPLTSEAGLLLLVALPFLFLHLDFPLLDPDEGLYAAMAQAMQAGGDWVVPRANGIPYVEKPPLYFWLTALALAAAGPAEWAVRLWSPLGALGAVLLTWRLGRRLYGPRAGLLAGLALASMAGSALFARRAATDFLFAFCLTLAVYGFVRDAERPGAGRGRFLLFYLGAALGVLAKGLIGLVFPALIVLVARGVARRLPLRELNLGCGLALFALVALPWHLALTWQAPRLSWYYLVENQVLRFLDARSHWEDDVPISTLGFLVVTFLWVFPWGVFALARPAPPAWPAARWRPVVWAWLAAVVGLFALSRFKHEYYAVPAFPAVALLAGAGWASGRDVGRWLAVALPGCGLVGAGALWAGAALTPAQALAGLAELNVYYRILREQGLPFPFASARPFGVLLQALGVVLIAGWGLAALAWWRGRRRGAFAAVLGVAAAIAVLIVQLFGLVEPHHTVNALAEVVRARAGPDDLLAAEGTLDYHAALPFYAGRPVLIVNGAVGYFRFASDLPEARGRFLDTAALGRLWQGPRRVFLVVRRPPAQSVAAALPAETVHVLARQGPRWLLSNRP